MDDYLGLDETAYESCDEVDKAQVDELMEAGMSLHEALAEVGLNYV